MGLSYAQDYSCRDHFRKRALERFGVDDQHLKRWINQHLPSLSPYESDVLQPADTKTYVSSDGVIFVCNIKSREFITCFKDLTHLLNRYRLKEAKELFENIEDDLDDFYHLSQAVKTGQLSERNFKRLEELLSKFHVIKAAMRIIENKRGDYHL